MRAKNNKEAKENMEFILISNILLCMREMQRW